MRIDETTKVGVSIDAVRKGDMISDVDGDIYLKLADDKFVNLTINALFTTKQLENYLPITARKGKLVMED